MSISEIQREIPIVASEGMAELESECVFLSPKYLVCIRPSTTHRDTQSQGESTLPYKDK